jgi:hypothetical protein
MPSCVVGFSASTMAPGSPWNVIGRRPAGRQVEARVVAGPHAHEVDPARTVFAAFWSVRQGWVAEPAAESFPAGST